MSDDNRLADLRIGVTSDTLRAAILAADQLHIENHGESCDCDVAPYLDPLAVLALLRGTPQR